MQEDLNRLEQDNIAEAYIWLKRTRPKDILSFAFIRTLHKRMFSDVWKWAGQFRLTDKNSGIPKLQIPAELKKLCDDGSKRVATFRGGQFRGVETPL